jgi:hypothetical protein
MDGLRDGPEYKRNTAIKAWCRLRFIARRKALCILSNAPHAHPPVIGPHRLTGIAALHQHDQATANPQFLGRVDSGGTCEHLARLTAEFSDRQPSKIGRGWEAKHHDRG